LQSGYAILEQLNYEPSV